MFGPPPVEGPLMDFKMSTFLSNIVTFAFVLSSFSFTTIKYLNVKKVAIFWLLTFLDL